jgi:hypothetical protein
MGKPVTMSFYPDRGQVVSRQGTEEARMVAIVRLDGMNGRGDERIGEAGQMTVRCTVNRWGLVSVEAQESTAASTERDLFYAQLVIDRAQPSGVRVRRETYPPARPDGAVNLSAAQAEAIRATLGMAELLPHTPEDFATINAARAALGMPAL